MSMPARLGLLTVRGIGEIHLKAGDRVWLTPDPARIHRFDKEGNGHPPVSGGDR